jgi:hypothetical protein
MTELTEPKKETVRITLPAKPAAPTTQTSSVASRALDRPDSTALASASECSDGGRQSTDGSRGGIGSGHNRSRRYRGNAVASDASAPPKKETARVTVLPDPPSRPAVQMKKTQPLIDLPAVERSRLRGSSRPKAPNRLKNCQSRSAGPCSEYPPRF